jgi:predicted nucleotidyltransferase
MQSLEKIKSSLSAKKEQLFKEYSIKSLAIFGSYSRGEENKSSDLDLIVEFSESIGIRFIDLAEELEKILSCKVDLVSKKGIKESYFITFSKDLIYV